MIICLNMQITEGLMMFIPEKYQESIDKSFSVYYTIQQNPDILFYKEIIICRSLPLKLKTL